MSQPPRPVPRQVAVRLRREGRVEELRRLADAGDPQGARQLARLLVRTGRVDELRRRAADGDGHARRRLADRLVGRGRIDDAIDELRQMARIGDESAARRLARLLAGRGLVEEAMAEMRRVRARPGDAWLVSGWLASQGRADLLLERAASGDDTAGHHLRGVATDLWRRGRLVEAVALLTLFDSSDRDLQRTLLHMARWWRDGRLHLREEAVELLGGVDHPLCRRTRAGLLLLQGGRDEAIGELRALAAGGDQDAERDLATVSSAEQPVRELRALAHTGGGYVCAVAFGPDGTTLAACCGNDPTILLWNPVTGELLHALPTPGVAGAAAFSPDGTLLAGHGGGRVQIWNPATGEHLREFDTEGYVADVAFSPDGASLASAALWDPGTGTRVRDLDRGKPRAVAFSPNGRVVATAGHATRRDPPARLWDPATGEHLRDLDAPADALAFSPDGTLLATAGPRHVRLWDATTGEHLRELGDSGAHAVAFHPGGRLLATGRRPGWAGAAVRLWDPVTGDHVHDLATPADALAFSPDGTLLATADSADGVVRLWPVGPLTAGLS